MKAWLLGLLVAGAVPFAWAWAKKSLPKLLAEWAMKQARLALVGGGVEDADVKELMRTVVLAMVKFAEKKLPDEGMGEQRMQLVLGLAFKLPLIGSHLKSHEPQLREVVELCVKEMDADLKKLQQENPT